MGPSLPFGQNTYSNSIGVKLATILKLKASFPFETMNDQHIS